MLSPLPRFLSLLHFVVSVARCTAYHARVFTMCAELPRHFVKVVLVGHMHDKKYTCLIKSDGMPTFHHSTLVRCAIYAMAVLSVRPFVRSFVRQSVCCHIRGLRRNSEVYQQTFSTQRVHYYGRPCICMQASCHYILPEPSLSFEVRTPSSELTERNSATLCHTSEVSRIEPDLKMVIQNSGVPSPKTWAQKLHIFGWFDDDVAT